MMNTKKLDTGSRDAISLLPDVILSDILCWLPMKEAASTSLLSKKWRNVFRLVPAFDFDGFVSVHPENGKPVRGESFKKFLERTQGDSPISKFSLKRIIRKDIEIAYVDSCIYDAVEHGVLEVDIRIEPLIERSLPSQLFTSETLVKLTVGTYPSPKGHDDVFLEIPSYVSLPSLKILFFDAIFFEHQFFTEVLLAGCPVLEELTMHRNDIAVPFNIISPSVKRLSLDYTSSWKIGYGHLSLDLPNLVYLDYSGFAMTKYLQANLDSLVEAKLDLQSLEYNRPELTTLIAGISNVEILHMSRNSVYVISLCIENRLLEVSLLRFNNLVSLSFGSKNKQGWKVLAYLLNQSPKLEILNVQDLNGYTCDISMPRNKVKVLNILGYLGTAEESKKLKSFLGKYECLERVQVDITQEDDGNVLRTKRDLMMLLGVSLPSKCEFKVELA